MVETRIDPVTFWTQVMGHVTDEDRANIRRIIAEAEPRRAKAKFNTGSISETAALALRALCAWARPLTIGEVGTFIGVSTLSMWAAWIFTCDSSNDCLANGIYAQHNPAEIRCFPYQTSTQMLRRLPKYLVTPVEFWFFDGLLSLEDAYLIRDMSKPDAVYVFDDFNGQFKGVQNVAKLHPLLPHHVLIPAAGPVQEDTTLAVLVPESRL